MSFEFYQYKSIYISIGATMRGGKNKGSLFIYGQGQSELIQNRVIEKKKVNRISLFC